MYKTASFHERMFIGSRTLCSLAHGPYVRWTMDILSFEWCVNFTRVAVLSHRLHGFIHDSGVFTV